MLLKEKTKNRQKTRFCLNRPNRRRLMTATLLSRIALQFPSLLVRFSPILSIETRLSIYFI